MQQYLEKQWAECMDDFSKTFSSVSYSLWLSPLQPLNIEEDSLVLTVPNELAKSTLERPNYRDKILSIIKQHFNLSNFVLILEQERDEYIKEFNLSHPNDEETIDISIIDKQVTKQNPFNPRYTFENFVVGTTNQVIYAACRAVAEQPGKRFNPLFIYGGVGLGKTHLLHAIGNYIWDHKTQNLNIVYITCEDFTNDFLEALRKKQDSLSEFREKYRNADILLVDDIQFIANREKTQEEFFHTFNNLYQAGKQIIISSDRQPKDIPTLTERLRSRFSSGFIQDIQPPDFETRLLIIQKKIELEDYSYAPGLDYLLAERLDNVNIREMEGILKKIHFYADMHRMK